MAVLPRRTALLSGILLAAACIWLLYGSLHTFRQIPKIRALPTEGKGFEELRRASVKELFGPGTLKPPGSIYSRTLVVPRMKSDDVSWIYEEIPDDIQKAIYVMDDPTADFHPPQNKGREAMAYLTYIIDHYNNLPDVVLFFHAHRAAWHNNIMLDLDSARTIRRLRPERVTRMGYMNARCHHDPGCPDWLHLDRPEVDYDEIKKVEEKSYTVKIWEELHPFDRIPPVLSQPCCAQFAVSRARIRANPIGQYLHYRNWLLQTSLDDQTSGRVMEYTWQYIFTRNAEFCPATHSCYCEGYGFCFGSAQKFQDWLDILREREGLDKQLDAMKANGTEQAIILPLQTKVDGINGELNKRRHDADIAGQDPANINIEAERTF